MNQPRKVAALPRGTDKKLQKFLKSLEQSGVLDWVKKLQEEFGGNDSRSRSFDFGNHSPEVYLVGGAVRDAIIGVAENKDLDFIVCNVSMKKLQKFLSKRGWLEELGKNFGVLKFKPKKYIKDKNFEALDIALPRKEISTSAGKYKDFKVKYDAKLKVEDDLSRRDFTINAIAIKLDELEIIDPFNGIADIKNKTIKCVGKPEQRLSEDYTRILRAIRLACQLDFEIDVKTKSVIKKLARHLNDKVEPVNPSVRTPRVSDGKVEFIAPREVVAKEFLKAIACNYLKAIELFDKLGILKVLMPEFLKMKKCQQPKKFHTEGDVWKHTVLALKNMNSKRFAIFNGRVDKLLEETRNKKQETRNLNNFNKDKLELILALLFHDIGKPLTIQTPKKDKVDRIRFNDHDNVGADLAHKICKRLALSAPANLGVNCDNISWLIRKHMMLVHGHPSEFKPTTVEKYFFSDKYPGQNLIKLAWLDTSATITANGPIKQDLINALLKRIKEMKKLVNKKQAKQSLPEPLLNGDEIMKILKIKPGREVGKVKMKLREKQLTGEIRNKKSAVEFVKHLEK